MRKRLEKKVWARLADGLRVSERTVLRAQVKGHLKHDNGEWRQEFLDRELFGLLPPTPDQRKLIQAYVDQRLPAVFLAGRAFEISVSTGNTGKGRESLREARECQSGSRRRLPP